MTPRQISSIRQRKYMSKFDIARHADIHPDTVVRWLCRAEFTHIVRRKVNATIQYYINQFEIDRIKELTAARKGEKKDVKAK